MGLVERRSLIVGLVVGVILGVLLGVLLFWGVFPVKWTDAHSYDLSPEAKAEYMALVADSYRLNKEPAQADVFLADWTSEEKEQAVADAIQMYDQAGEPAKVQAVKDLALVLGISEVPTTPPEQPPSLYERLRVPCLVFFIVLLVLVLGWIGLRMLLRQRMPAPVGRVAPMAQPVAPPMRAEEWAGVGQPPLGHFFTTYQLGEDTYDESFSIETPMNEFLGECGVGISETIGVGDPDKVTAFEVWLFDKSDIRTVTKVLMSDHAYHDDALRAKLASKGEAVLAEAGSPFTLETSGLQVRVDVTELIYGEGEQPPRSFFSKLTVELVAMAKPAESDVSAY
jgi:hypothetical protein